MDASSLLYDFEARGGICESLEVLKRTPKYTDHFCKFTDGEDVFYSELRVYANGIACISILGVDQVDAWVSEKTQAKAKVYRSQEIWMNRERMLENKWRRDGLRTWYGVAFGLALLLLLAVTVLMILGVISLVEGGIYIALLIMYFVLQRKIWYKKIVQIGHDEVNYYEIYK